MPRSISAGVHDAYIINYHLRYIILNGEDKCKVVPAHNQATLSEDVPHA